MANATEADQTTAIHMLLENKLLGRIEDYRFQHRFKTRVETIKALLEAGLSAKPEKNGKTEA
jgi:hypothetical protein